MCLCLSVVHSHVLVMVMVMVMMVWSDVMAIRGKVEMTAELFVICVCLSVLAKPNQSIPCVQQTNKCYITNR
jgi:ABC-type transport system involved in cytochrome bd biosynthesis fused ATPase/permease subunit